MLSSSGDAGAVWLLRARSAEEALADGKGMGFPVDTAEPMGRGEGAQKRRAAKLAHASAVGVRKAKRGNR
jgi:hypothetical protein